MNEANCSSRKAQVSLFIIIGLVIFIGMVLFFLIFFDFRDDVSIDSISQRNDVAVNSAVTGCFLIGTEEILRLSGLKGGLIVEEEDIYLNNGEEFYKYSQLSNYSLPDANLLEKQLSQVVSAYISNCLENLNFEDLFDFEYQIVSINVDINLERVDFSMLFNAFIEENDVRKTLQSEFESSYPFSLGKLITIRKTFLDMTYRTEVLPSNLFLSEGFNIVITPYDPIAFQVRVYDENPASTFEPFIYQFVVIYN